MKNTFSRRFLNTVSLVVLSVSLILPSIDAEAKSSNSSRSKVHAPKGNKKARSGRQSRGSRKGRARSAKGRGKAGGNAAALQAAQAQQLAIQRQIEAQRLAEFQNLIQAERQIEAHRAAELQRLIEAERQAQERERVRLQTAANAQAGAQPPAQERVNPLDELRQNQAREQAQYEEAIRQSLVDERLRQEREEVERVAQEEQLLRQQEEQRQAQARERARLQAEIDAQAEEQRQVQARERAAQEEANRLETLRQALANGLEANRQMLERERLAAQEEQERVRQAEVARLEKERQAAILATVPLVAEGQDGLTVSDLLDQLKTKQKLHGVFLFVRQDSFENFTEEHRKDIIAIVEQKRTKGLIKNKEEATLALQEEAIRIRCTTFIVEQQDLLEKTCVSENRQPRDNEILLTDAEKEKCIEAASALFTSGKITNLKGAVDGALTILCLKKAYNIDDEEAANLCLFIRASKVKDRDLARYYYDLAYLLYESSSEIGLSVENNRELLALILQNEVTNEPQKLSADDNERWEYAKKHVMAILNSPSPDQPDQYFESLADSHKKKELADLFENEKRLKAVNQNAIFDRINIEKKACVLSYKRANDNIPKNYTLVRDTNNLIQAYYDLDDLTRGQQTKFNFQYFYQDPYLIYSLDADKKLSQQVVTQEQITNLCTALIICFRNAYGNDPMLWSYEENITNALLTQINACADGKRQNSMRARMIRALQCTTVTDDAISKDPLLAFAREISTNDSSRCIDGINEWLTAYEMKWVYKAPKDAGFPVIVSSLLNQEKIKFLSAHKPPEQGELATEGPELLKQRMRLGFGLPVSFSPVSYSSMAGATGTTAYIYDPVLVLERFFKGGSLTFNYFVEEIGMVNGLQDIIRIPKRFDPIPLQAFTVDRFIDLIRTAWLNEELRDDILTTEIQKDWVLRKAYEQVFDGEEGQGDIYFKNVEKKEEKYQPFVFKRLLCRSGFLIDETEPAFNQK